LAPSRRITTLEESTTPFRFLSEAEYTELSVKEKAEYLSRVAQELEARKKVLREQMAQLDEERRLKGE
jgi:hypothetical protein